MLKPLNKLPSHWREGRSDYAETSSSETEPEQHFYLLRVLTGSQQMTKYVSEPDQSGESLIIHIFSTYK